MECFCQEKRDKCYAVQSRSHGTLMLFEVKIRSFLLLWFLCFLHSSEFKLGLYNRSIVFEVNVTLETCSLLFVRSSWIVYHHYIFQGIERVPDLRTLYQMLW
jgi:hypothetical protein